MALVRPFRGIRAVQSRVDPAVLLAPAGALSDADARALLAQDPRNVAGLAGGVGPAAARARFLLGEQLRAGVLTHDPLPSLYVLKREGGGIGFFALVDAGSVDAGAHDGDIDDAGYDVEAAVLAYVDKKGRIARSLESETEREPDCAFTFAGTHHELWAVDDDSAAARITTLLETAEVTVKDGHALLGGGAGRLALAFFVDQEDPAAPPPRGCVYAPRGRAT